MLLTYEPLLNRQRAVTGSRLQVHGTDSAQELTGLLDVWPAPRTVLVAFDTLPHEDDLALWQTPANTMVEFSVRDLEQNPKLPESLDQRAVPFCLSGVTSPVLPAGNFRFVLADPHLSAEALPCVALAHGLPDAPAFEACLHRGFAGAAGWFFLKGGKPSGRLLPSYAHIVRLVGMVSSGAELKEIERALKQDLALSYRLLRYINLVGFGLSCEIQSFRHAVAIMGMQKLNRWLALLLVGASHEPLAPAMVHAAIVRGRLMEILGESFFDRAELDNLFITGAFSLLDALLGTPAADILDEMRLPESIGDALLRSQGAYAPLLALARTCEGGNPADLGRQVETLGLEPAAVNRALLKGLRFAEDLLA
ncbi:MAG: HDOD domain-containing protein [Rhodocyclaceae bacterium]|nr:HDOD domain-containing protein [Rhodocyclaceae bacterium]